MKVVRALEYIPAKTIVSSRYEGGWFGSNYTMNLYKGCCHGCIYCDSRSECYQIRDFDRVKAKENALEIIARDLRGKRQKGMVITGAMSDPYNPFEETLCLTRGALELLDQYGFGAAIDTKSPLVTRDTDILKRIQRHSPVSVSITITTAEDDLCRKVERHVAVSSRRFEALEELSRQGIPCGILLMPLLPFINDTEKNVRAIVRKAKGAGAKWIFAYPGMGVTLRQNQRVYFYDRLDESFPGLREKYLQVYGDQYECVSPRSKELWQELIHACDENGLLYRMEDISLFLHAPYRVQQMSLFQ